MPALTLGLMLASSVSVTSTLGESVEEGHKRFALAAVELATLEVAVWSVDKWIRGEHWVDVTPSIWWRNVSEGWEYDGDGFETNYFGHPYHGALFFDAARSNGFDFWESASFALAGSALWEYFGETYRPAFNDWILSGISGANLGEVLHRLSVLATDNTATGVERVLRELAGAVVDPVRGFTRLVTGDCAAVFANPPDREPSFFVPVLQVGGRAIDVDGRSDHRDPTYQLLLKVDLSHGRAFSREIEPPFSSFHFGASIAVYDRGGKTVPQVTRVSSEGLLAGWTIQKRRGIEQRVGATLVYDYVNNPAFEFGQTSLAGTWDAEIHLLADLTVTPGAGLLLVLMGATPNDYFEDPEGRTYDLGPGVGLTAWTSVRLGEATVARASYSSGWLWPMSLPGGSRHHLHFAMIEGRLPMSSLLALGAGVSMYWRESDYDDHPDVSARNPIVELFVAISP